MRRTTHDERGTMNARRIRRAAGGCRSAFTMTEMLIVIGLVVLMIALAVPTFSFITGSRSTDGAINQISAMLARARTEAIGLQEIRGLFFFLDPRTERVHMIIVNQTERPSGGGPLISQVQTFLDIPAEAEAVALPAGVGLQTITNCSTLPNGVRTDDNYVGFNIHNARSSANATRSDTPFGSVILFDSKGRLIVRRFAFRTFDSDTNQRTLIGDLLLKPDGDLNTANDSIPMVVPWVSTTNLPLQSSLGVVLFEQEAFRNLPRQPGREDAPKEWDSKLANNEVLYGNGSADWHESFEEQWLDGLAVSETGRELSSGTVHCLVNRYNGTLIRAD